MEVDAMKRLKELENENARLKKIVADQAVDIDILKEVSRGNDTSRSYWARARTAARGDRPPPQPRLELRLRDGSN
jgi:hypothetical protein